MVEFEQNSSPIYLQIVNQIKSKIISGQYCAGMKMETVRELALKFKVNPNTMQRALLELEREGLCYSERTTGRYITQDCEIIKNTKSKVAKELTQNFISDMKKLNITKQEVLALLKELELQDDN